MAVKARDIRRQLQGKLDPEVLHILEALAEDASVQKQRLVMMAQLVSTLIDRVNDLTKVMGVFKDKLKKPKERDFEDVPDDTTTH